MSPNNKRYTRKNLSNSSYLLKKIKSNNITNKLYNKYKLGTIPIECLINLCLLLNGIRKIIQYDRYLYTKTNWKLIQELVNDNLIQKYITTVYNKKNIMIYIKNKHINKILEKCGHDCYELGNLLDHKFYKCNFDGVYKHENILRVSIIVIGPVSNNKLNNNKVVTKGKILKKKNFAGPILIQMCTHMDLLNNIKAIYKRFNDYKKYVWDIDKNLQLDFQCYIKNNNWDKQPSFITNQFIYTN